MATRRQIFTAAAHQVLLDNPEMYRNISNLQALRREQAGRWAQQMLLLNDPGPGMVERAFMNAGEMDEQIPKLLETRAKILKPIQEKAAKALDDKMGYNGDLVKILTANISAEGQIKASGVGAIANVTQAQFDAAIKVAQGKADLLDRGIDMAAPKDDAGLAKVDSLFRAALGKDAGGGNSPTVDATEALRTATPSELAGLMKQARETGNQDVYDTVKGALQQAGRMDEMLSHVASSEAYIADATDTYTLLGIESQLSKPDGDSRTQADMALQNIKGAFLNSGPGRGKMLRETLDALGDEKYLEQLDAAISQEISPEEKKALDQVDEALKKAQENKELASPTEIREQMRTSAGGVETFQEKLKQAGVEDEKLIGMGAAFRRAARQQARGQVKELEGEGDAAVVNTRRLALSKAEALARKNKAPGWADYSDAPSNGVTSKPEAKEAAPSRPGIDPKLDELPDKPDEKVEVEAPAATSGGVDTRGAAYEAGAGALDAGRAARRSGALNSLRTLLSKPRSVAPIAEPENEEEVYVDTGPRPRPPGYKWGSGRV